MPLKLSFNSRQAIVALHYIPYFTHKIMPTDNNSTGTDYRALYEQAKRWLGFEANYTRLTAVEKLSILLSAVAYVAVLLILGGYVLLTLTDTLAIYLATALGNAWLANLIVVGVVLLLIVVIVALKKQLIVNPITRFISRLLLKPNDNNH